MSQHETLRGADRGAERRIAYLQELLKRRFPDGDGGAQPLPRGGGQVLRGSYGFRIEPDADAGATAFPAALEMTGT